MEIKELFPDIILIDKTTSEELQVITQELQSAKPEISKIIREGTWGDNITTTFICCKDVIKDYNLFNLKNFIEPRVKEYLKTYNYYKKITSFYLTESWLNISYTNNFQNTHIHRASHSMICGVFYVDVKSENSGNLTFIPGLNEEMLKGHYEVTPETGKIVIFHGALPHCVKYNRSDTPRVSISFNYSVNLDN